MANHSSFPGLKPVHHVCLTLTIISHPKFKSSTCYFLYLACSSPSSICMAWISLNSSPPNFLLKWHLSKAFSPMTANLLTTPHSLSSFPTLSFIMWYIFYLSALTTSKLKERMDACFVHCWIPSDWHTEDNQGSVDWMTNPINIIHAKQHNQGCKRNQRRNNWFIWSNGWLCFNKQKQIKEQLSALL